MTELRPSLVLTTVREVAPVANDLTVTNWFGDLVSHPAVIVDAHTVDEIVPVLTDPGLSIARASGRFEPLHGTLWRGGRRHADPHEDESDPLIGTDTVRLKPERSS